MCWPPQRCKAATKVPPAHKPNHPQVGAASSRRANPNEWGSPSAISCRLAPRVRPVGRGPSLPTQTRSAPTPSWRRRPALPPGVPQPQESAAALLDSFAFEVPAPLPTSPVTPPSPLDASPCVPPWWALDALSLFPMFPLFPLRFGVSGVQCPPVRVRCAFTGNARTPGTDRGIILPYRQGRKPLLFPEQFRGFDTERRR